MRCPGQGSQSWCPCHRSQPWGRWNSLPCRVSHDTTEVSLVWTQRDQTPVPNLESLLGCRQARGTYTWTPHQAYSTLCSEQELERASHSPSPMPAAQAPEHC